MGCGFFFSFDRRMVCGGDGGMPYSRHDVFGPGTLLGWVSILRTVALSLLKANVFSRAPCCAVLNSEGASCIPPNQ